ncbi:hypothetical protein AXY37_10610 [Mammaliicoccus lentus]|uniref:AIPR family protein n=1 Tax=Mammaliicoccus lentus TaxID=42858 RepID=UPI0007D96B0A|nr:AIPR family protein [Mammaliicoccus lentus]MBF0748892.1 AIPR family protein [Mammaliicoccus lentus]OAO28510.1 hypothetical protein AXY37_10610 [Mammaliicoccus lentus]TFU58493.1 hypothetical protein E4T93_05695 [Mammaliicoccus lentus]
MIAKQKDYDLIEKMSLKYAKKLDIQENNLDEKENARLGFYYLGLNLVLGFQDIHEISEKITDSSFQAKVNGISNQDYGIDAIHIDKEAKKVALFSFKYRDKLTKGTTKSPSDLTSTSAFLGLLKRKENIDVQDAQLTAEIIKEINDWENNESEIEFSLYLISNDNTKLEQDDASVKEFYSNYSWLNIYEENLADIIDQVSLKPESNDAEIILNKTELLQHDLDGYTTANSYVAKVKLIDLIRITSKDHTLRTKESIDDAEVIKEQEIDLNVLFDNVRGYLGKTGNNEKIITTLKEEPNKFFLFNNGLTITAEDIIVNEIKFEEYYRIKLKNFQIVNGGQTLRTIYSFKDNNIELINNLAQSSVLIRFFKTGLEEGLINKVSEYTNSQNAISGRDLKSVDKIQLDIESRFRIEGINYIRKINKVDNFDNECTYEISMEKLGQLLLAVKGHPEKSSNSKKRIFEDYYSYLFNDETKFMDQAINLVKEYHSIIENYANLKPNVKFYEQKVFYIVYLNKFIESNSTLQNIDILEQLIINYRKDEDIPPARKLIQKKFKEIVDDKIFEVTNEKPVIINITKKNR